MNKPLIPIKEIVIDGIISRAIIIVVSNASSYDICLRQINSLQLSHTVNYTYVRPINLTFYL